MNVSRKKTIRHRFGGALLSCFVLMSSSSMLMAEEPASISPLRSDLLSIVDQAEPMVIEWRRHVHQNPELAFEEVETAAYIADALRNMKGMDVQTGIAKTGIKAVLKGGRPGPVVALRADMDGLPVEERNDLPFRSTKTGSWKGKDVKLSHACGHDTHVAMLLGAAHALSQMQEQLPGTVVFLFQPAEEFGPGAELSGAPAMVREGVLENPKVDVVMGQHIGPGYPSGQIGYRRGALMASGESLSITLTGKGGHGAMPWTSTSPTLAAAQIILAMQNIISHRINPIDGPLVLTFGTLNSGVRKNVLSDTAELSGTMRSLSKANQEIAHEHIPLIAENIAAAYGVEADIKFNTGGYEVLISDPEITEELIPSFRQAAGEKGAIEVPPSTGSEDFGSFGADIPAVFWRLNASPFADRAGAPNHSPEFVVDEAALRIGVRALVNNAVSYMEKRTPKGN